jgi:hypothetical protein
VKRKRKKSNLLLLLQKDKRKEDKKEIIDLLKRQVEISIFSKETILPKKKE